MKDKKVVLTYYDVEENIAEETLWIEQKSEKEYQIKNIPFFAPNIAYNDIISVEEEDGVLHYEDIITPSEHSTIQIIVLKEDKTNDILKNFERLGCSWEGMHNQKLLAIDVPQNIIYKKIREYLNILRINNIIDFKEACLSITHYNQVKN
jgi:hypothetical protein